MPSHLLAFLLSTDVLSPHCFQITIKLSIIQKSKHLGQGKMGKTIQSGNGRKCFLQVYQTAIPTSDILKLLIWALLKFLIQKTRVDLYVWLPDRVERAED